MIYGKIADIKQYSGISKWFDVAIEFLSLTNLDELPLGKTLICGEHVFINVMEADSKKAEEVDFEVHARYWDIQIDMEGEEEVQIGIGEKKTKEAVCDKTDFGTVTCDDHVTVTLKKGLFVICMNQEPHKPTLQTKECKHVKKCVLKVESIN